MLDREKYIEVLSKTAKTVKEFNEDASIKISLKCIEDILELLKEQETKLICNLLGGQPYEVYCRECRTVLCILGKGETMNDVKRVFSYCPHCGRLVKWE